MIDFPNGYTVYLAGPMRGLPLYNFPAFHDATKRLRNLGLTVISPAEMDVASGMADLRYDASAEPQLVSVILTEKFNIETVLANDLEAIRGVDEVILLPGWERSEGVATEMKEAMKHGIRVSHAHAWDGYIYGVYTGKPDLPEAVYIDAYIDCWAESSIPRTRRCVSDPTPDRLADRCSTNEYLYHAELDDRPPDETVEECVHHPEGSATCSGAGPLSWEAEYAPRRVFDSLARFAFNADGALEGGGEKPVSGGEIRLTDPVTGGQKGMKPERMELIPPEALAEMARVYAHGAEKYAPFNWLRGYPWSWSVGALARHLNRYQAGERRDTESGLHHLAHAMFHCAALMEFERLGRGTDDLPWGKDLDTFLASLPKD